MGEVIAQIAEFVAVKFQTIFVKALQVQLTSLCKGREKRDKIKGELFMIKSLHIGREMTEVYRHI